VKLLLVTDAVGGVWIYSLELARALRERGVEPVLAVTGPAATPEQRRQAEGITLLDTGLPLDWLDTSPGDLARAGKRLAAIADREAADVVQTCSAALLAEADFTQPTVAVQHSCVASWWAAVRGTALPPEFAWRRDLVERGLKRASALVAPSAAFAAETQRLYGLRGAVRAVHNGRSARQVSDGPPAQLVVTASRLWDEGKNVATLDAAAAALDVPFQAAGPLHGPNGARAHLDNLDCVGELSEHDLGAMLSRRPVFASAALYEPFGLSVLEAAQAGCALVLSDIPTFRELWEGAATFVSARDAQGFAAAIQCLLNDGEERARLGAAARSKAARYTPEATAEAMIEIYARVTAPAPLELAGAA
jgi:glycosyltransferase involved in cell wall biosynthesis